MMLFYGDVGILLNKFGDEFMEKNMLRDFFLIIGC